MDIWEFLMVWAAVAVVCGGGGYVSCWLHMRRVVREQNDHIVDRYERFIADQERIQRAAFEAERRQRLEEISSHKETWGRAKDATTRYRLAEALIVTQRQQINRLREAIRQRSASGLWDAEDLQADQEAQ